MIHPTPIDLFRLNYKRTKTLRSFIVVSDTSVKMSRLTLPRRSLPNIKGEKSPKLPRILLNRTKGEATTLNKVSFTTLLENAKRAANKKSKKKLKVRLKLPNEPTPRATPDKGDPFENNWLVDTPRVILSEKTMMDFTSPLQKELEGFYEEVAYVPEEEYDNAVSATRSLVRYLTRKFNKLGDFKNGLSEYKNGLKILPAVFAGSTFDKTQSMNITDVDILLCFELYDKAKVETLQPGYQIINLPRHKEKEGGGGPPDVCMFGRSEDGQYLSTRTVSWLFYSMIERLVAPRKDTILQPYTINEGKSHIIVTVNEKYNIHILPAAWDKRVEAHLVMRPYIYDDNPFSDMMWRYSYTQDEHLLFKTMASADRGCRLKVYQILKALIRVEHTLEGLTGYQVKTVLLHMFDADVDNTPRWQRGNMEACFMNVLRELKHYFVRRNLPHFFVKGQNLLENMPDRTWNNLKSRISFLVGNPRECVRILKKRSRLQFNELTGRCITDSVTSIKTI